VHCLEPARDRSGGRERELLADHLRHQRAPQVGSPVVEEGVGVELGVRVHERRHPRVRRAQHRPAIGPPIGAQPQAFPDGVCDYSKPGIDQHGAIPWLTYQDKRGRAYGGKPMGPPPVSHRIR
jgi:hypothetical protein